MRRLVVFSKPCTLKDLPPAPLLSLTPHPPLQVGTTSVEDSERMAMMLRHQAIAHSLLNARPKYAAAEAQVRRALSLPRSSTRDSTRTFPSRRRGAISPGLPHPSRRSHHIPPIRTYQDSVNRHSHPRRRSRSIPAYDRSPRRQVPALRVAHQRSSPRADPPRLTPDRGDHSLSGRP